MDVWVASGADATPQAIAATVRDALPVVMPPVSRARDVVNVSAVLTLGVLLRQACGFAAGRAALAALAFLAIVTLARTP